MLEILGDRQKQLMRMLLRHKAGLSVDQLAAGLRITRNAVRQHLAALARDGLATLLDTTRPSGGRPQQLYALTDKGRELFPRHYSWFAQLVVDAIKREHGADGLRKRLTEMGREIAGQLRAQNPELATREQKSERLAVVMDQLGYNAKAVASGKAPAIEADNCVFHQLAMKNPEICHFDLAMLGTFTDSKVELQECMARGGNVCRFKFSGKK